MPNGLARSCEAVTTCQSTALTWARCTTIITLPMYPTMTEADVAFVAAAANEVALKHRV